MNDKNIRMIVLVSLAVLLVVLILRQRREQKQSLEFEITPQDELELKQSISDEYIGDIGQRNVLLQGDALEYQRQQIGKGSRTFDYDPMASPYGKAGGFDKITDTSGYFKEAGNIRSASLKVFNPKTGLYEAQNPLATLEGGLAGFPGFDTSSKLLAEV